MSVRGCACTLGSHPSPAWWQSGHAADCKSAYAGSIPTQASSISRQPASAGFLLRTRSGAACRRRRAPSGRRRSGRPPARILRPHRMSPLQRQLTAMSVGSRRSGQGAHAARSPTPPHPPMAASIRPDPLALPAPDASPIARRPWRRLPAERSQQGLRSSGTESDATVEGPGGGPDGYP